MKNYKKKRTTIIATYGSGKCYIKYQEAFNIVGFFV